MNIKKFFFPSLLVGAVVALILRSFTKRASAKPNTNDAPNDATAKKAITYLGYGIFDGRK